jgi:hypothetical protein
MKLPVRGIRCAIDGCGAIPLYGHKLCERCRSIYVLTPEGKALKKYSALVIPKDVLEDGFVHGPLYAESPEEALESVRKTFDKKLWRVKIL